MKRSILVLLAALGLYSAKASHIQGGNITYNCLGGNQYELVLTMFFDCGTYSINTSGYSTSLTITNDCGLANPGPVTLNWDQNNSNLEVSQLCGSQIPNSECNGGTQPGVWQATWTGIVTLPGQCNSWHFWYSTCCWNTNTNTPGTPGQLYHTTLNNTAAVGGCDSSPIIAGQQIPYLCVGQPNTYSIGASDPNGNNIVYSLVAAQEGNPGSATSVSYNAGYSGTAPIPGITINPNTGLMTVTPSATGNYIIQVNITTYDNNGNVIGVVSHQFQIIVVNCTNTVPAPPAGGVSGGTGNITFLNQSSVQFCAGQNGCFDVVFTDPDVGNTLTVTTNVTSALPGATVNITGTNPVTATVCWTPTPGYPPNASLTFTAEDNACPITGINSFNVDVSVIATCCNPPTMSSTPVCAGSSTGSVTAQANAIAPYNYVWVNTGTGATVATQNGLPGASTVNNLPAGTYQVTVTDANGCVQTGTVTITANPLPTVTVNSTSICAGNNATLTATPNPTGGTFSWSPGGQTTQSITVSPATTTTYTVTYNLNGCTNTGSGTVTINPAPTVTVNSTTVCAGTSATLTATPSVTGGTFSWSPGGQTTQSITVTPGTTTTYTVTYSLAGCTNTGTGTVTVNPVPTVTVNSATVCAGTSATLTATPSAAGGTYSWSPGGQTTQSITVSPGTTTTYTVTYTLNGCTNTGTGTVTVNPIPTVTVNNATVCPGQTATLTATPNPAGGTFSWAPGGQTTSSISVSPATTTTYTVTYSLNGCTATGSGTVTIGGSVSVSVNSVTVCAGQPATLTATPGTPGGTFSWAPGGQTTQNITVTPATTSSYTVTYDLGGCTGTATGTVTVNAQPTLNVSSTTICNGNPGTITATPSVTGGTFSWTPGGQTTSGITVTPASTTTYNVTYSLNGCTATGSGTVSVVSNPTANFTPTTVCEGVATQFTDLSSPGVISWTYDFGDGSPTSSLQNPIHTYATAGTYNATLTVSLTGCTGSATIPVTVNPMPVAAFTTTPACPGTNITVNNTSSVASGTISTYAWTMPSGSVTSSPAQNPTYSYAGGGTYPITLVVTSSGGCIDSVTQNINIPYMPVPDFSFTQVCEGNPTSFTDLSTVTGGTITGWNWTWGDAQPAGTTQNPTHTYATAGTYSVTMTPTTNAGCSGPSVTYSVDVFAQPIAAFTVQDQCISNAVVPVNTSTPAASYAWDFGDGTPIDPNQNPTHTYTSPGTYTITLTLTSGTCTDVVTNTVNVFAMPVVSFTQTDVCNGLPMNFTDGSTVAGGTIATWAWTFGDGNTSAIQNPTNSYPGPGTYNVSLTVTSADGCSGSFSQPVNVFDAPIVSFSAGSVCEGQATQFQNLSTVSSGSMAGYQWNFGDGQTGSQTSPSHVYGASGSYNVTLIGTSSNGCTDTITLPITVNALPVISFSADNLAACEPLCTNFTDASTVAGGTITSWSWNFGDGATSSVQNPSHCYVNNSNNAQFPDVTLTVTSAAGCTSTFTDIDMLAIYPIPHAEFSFLPIPATDLNPVITFTNLSIGGSTYQWYFGDGDSSTVVSPVHTYPGAAVYDAYLITTSQYGCVDTAYHEVFIAPEFHMYVPNAFSPDGNGTNDIFIPVINGHDRENYKFMIFDRWGELIFSTTNDQEGWDGTYKGVKAKSDVYVWKVQVKDIQNHENKAFYGHVNLLR